MKSFPHWMRRLSALCLAFSVSTWCAQAAFTSSFSYSYPIGDGLTYTRTEGRDGAGLQKVNVLSYQPSASVRPIVLYAKDTLYESKSTVEQAIAYAAQRGQTVLGGVNADFFVLDSSLPIGLVIDNGTLVSSDAWQYAVGFRADGSAILGQPKMGITLAGDSGTVHISYYNKTRTSAGAYLLDHMYHDTTRFSRTGDYIVLERTDNAPVKVNGTVRLTVVDKGTGDSPLPLTENRMVLTRSADAQVPSWVDFPIGEQVTLSIRANDARWGEVMYAAGGKSLIQNGKITANDIDNGASRRARTAVGVKADGTVVLYEIDGNQPAHSVGLTAADLAADLAALGCVDAICLDGGGSSVMAVREPGTDTASLTTSPSGGSPRAVANYIFFVNQVPADGVTAHAILTPSARYVLPMASVPLTVRGADTSYAPAPTPEGLTYTVSGGLGEVTTAANGTLLFTAGQALGRAVITASDGQAISGSTEVNVTEEVSAIYLYHGAEPIDRLSLDPGQTVDLTALAYFHGIQMASNDTLFSWSLSSADLGTLTEDGQFTAGEQRASGTLTCRYGSVERTIDLSVGMGDPQKATTVADFEAGVQPFAAQEGTALTLLSGAQVARGQGALSVGLTPNTPAALTIEGVSAVDAAYLSLWARSEDGQGTLTAVFTDAGGGEMTVDFDRPVGAEWQQLQVELPEGAIGFAGLRFASEQAHILMLDHIVLSAHHPITNTDTPVLTLSAPTTPLSEGQTATLTGTATMENDQYPIRTQNLLVRVDGAVVSDAATNQGGALVITTGALSAGTHTVTVDGWDDAGNRARAAVTLQVGETTSPFADTAGHWAQGYAAQLFTRGLMQGETNGDTRLFAPDRAISRAEFAVTLARLLGLDTTQTAPLPFTDDASIPSWARGAIHAVYTAGYMNGKANGDTVTFAPAAAMTRAEVMTVLGRCLPRGYADTALSFGDAASIPDWARAYVQQCTAAGLIGGYQDNTIRPNNTITRGEIAKVLALF